ncbi:MAG TPA: DedA family protein [Acidimicrobiales bacterium]|nr:DedA family protein [Acidimicrobiales bacterium]
MTHFLYTWGYAAVFVLSFISSMGLPVGAELAIIGGGALASGQVGQGDHLNLAIVILLATLGEVLGSAAGYAIGRYGGRPLVDRVGKYVLLTHKDLDRAEAWFARRGEPVVFFGRFIPLLRSFVSFAAGLGEMAIGKFLLYTVIACAIWCSALASIGYSLGKTYDNLVHAFSYAGYVLVALAVVAVVVVFWHRYRSYKAEQVQGRHERQA